MPETDTATPPAQTRRWLAFARRVVAYCGGPRGTEWLTWETAKRRILVDDLDTDFYTYHAMWPADHWNDASGLPATLRPGDHALPGDEYHRPHLCGVDDRERRPVRDVACPACEGDGYWIEGRPPYFNDASETACATCGGTGRVSVVAAIAWELERTQQGKLPIAGMRWLMADDGRARRHVDATLPDDRYGNEFVLTGNTTSELARRLAPVWRLVQQTVMMEQRVDDDASGYQHWGAPKHEWLEKHRRQQSADVLVLSSGRRVDRAFLLG